MNDKPFTDAGDHLQAELERIQTLAKERIASAAKSQPPQPYTGRAELEHRMELSLDAGVDLPTAHLVRRFGLNDVETDILMVLLAPHLDPTILPLYRELRGAGWWDGVELRLLLALLAHNFESGLALRKALSASGNLLPRGLAVLRPSRNSPSMLHWVADISPALVHHLVGEEKIGRPPNLLCTPQTQPVDLRDVVLLDVPIDVPLARLSEQFELDNNRAPTIILLTGPSGTGKTSLARAFGTALGRPVLSLNSDLVRAIEAQEPLAPQLRLELELKGGLLLIEDAHRVFASDSPIRDRLLSAVDQLRSPVILTARSADDLDQTILRRCSYAIQLARPDSDARFAIWSLHLKRVGIHAARTDVAAVANTYPLTGAEIDHAVRTLVHLTAHEPAHSVAWSELSSCAESQLRSSLAEYTLTLSRKRRLSDLCLEPDTLSKVHELLHACQHRRRVMDDWGFRDRLSTGHGIVALFDGPPGTGKTFCAEILGAELSYPVARINIPSVVSKWVGETEERIHDIFRRGRASRSILLFDEADSLFGHRVSETRSATDRYANMSVNLLLQEIERYDGVVILTTNLATALDNALMRRIQFRITFPEPDVTQRALVFRHMVPKGAPVAANVDFEQLAEDFELSGGRIQNAVLRAAYRAVADGAPHITMRHFWESAAEEARSAGKVVQDWPQLRKES